MTLFKITNETIQRARERHLALGRQFNGASIPGGKGRFYGFLGEEVVMSFLGSSAILESTKDYDIRFLGKTFDVKTKTRKDIPRPTYDATVDQSSGHQRPDYYIFCSIMAPQNLIKQSEKFIVNYQYEEAYILGFLPREEFYAKARHFRAGDIDPSNGVQYRDSINLVRIDQLWPEKRLLEASKIFVAST